MLFNILLLFLSLEFASSGGSSEFTYNGFSGTDLHLDGIAQMMPNGLLRLTDSTREGMGHAFHSLPLRFKNSSDGNALSISTTFAFAIVPEYGELGGNGIAFVLSPSLGLPGALAMEYLGLFNSTNNGNTSNHVVAVELDTMFSVEFGDIDDNHVGIDLNGLRSFASSSAAYVASQKDGFKKLNLKSGEPMQVWIEYSGTDKRLNATLSPINTPKPSLPLLSVEVDLSSTILDTMFVGFSSSTGAIITNHYVLGWSFKMNGEARLLDLSHLPQLPRRWPKHKRKTFIIVLSAGLMLAVALISGLMFYIRRKKMFAEIIEDWESEYASHRFSYRELYTATKSFGDSELLGAGGFGRVYRGLLPSGAEVAVKRVSHESRQGMREFIAEITSIGQLRHRNLVRLLGYCRRKGELLLVYEFMPNGSLDKFLFDQPKLTLSWSQRFQILKDIASALYYLHEEWKRVVIHRDIKASNVLLNSKLVGKLGDFGLARLYDHGNQPRTTHVVGTPGYLAPELPKTGKASTLTDVFAFGALLLEVACGRRPLELQESGSDLILVNWVTQLRNRGVILEASDPRLAGDYVEEEMELVLRLGLRCTDPMPSARPSMRQVMQFLDGDAFLPEMPQGRSAAGVSTFWHEERLHDFVVCDCSSPDLSSDVESLSSGR